VAYYDHRHSGRYGTNILQAEGETIWLGDNKDVIIWLGDNIVVLIWLDDDIVVIIWMNDKKQYHLANNIHFSSKLHALVIKHGSAVGGGGGTERTGPRKADLGKEEALTWTCSIGMDMQDRHGHAAVTCTRSINMSRRVIYEF
jgi:hypothetical protein